MCNVKGESRATRTSLLRDSLLIYGERPQINISGPIHLGEMAAYPLLLPAPFPKTKEKRAHSGGGTLLQNPSPFPVDEEKSKKIHLFRSKNLSRAAGTALGDQREA